MPTCLHYVLANKGHMHSTYNMAVLTHTSLQRTHSTSYTKVHMGGGGGHDCCYGSASRSLLSLLMFSSDLLQWVT